MLSRPSTLTWWQWLVAPTVGERPHVVMLTYSFPILMASPTRVCSAKYCRLSMTVVSSVFLKFSRFSQVIPKCLLHLEKVNQTTVCSQGFLTDDLVSHEENGEQKKYLGVCRLLGPGHRHRRLDIIVVPYSEFACALMYFTGSAHFNRSMRALAKTKNMSLSEHSLNENVVRQGSIKVYGGTPFTTPTEKDVFSLLGIPYREPHERDW